MRATFGVSSHFLLQSPAGTFSKAPSGGSSEHANAGYAAARTLRCTLRPEMYFSKCISQNIFLKMYFSKCISQNVFLKMYFSKCISQNGKRGRRNDPARPRLRLWMTSSKWHLFAIYLVSRFWVFLFPLLVVQFAGKNIKFDIFLASGKSLGMRDMAWFALPLSIPNSSLLEELEEDCMFPSLRWWGFEPITQITNVRHAFNMSD